MDNIFLPRNFVLFHSDDAHVPLIELPDYGGEKWINFASIKHKTNGLTFFRT